MKILLFPNILVLLFCFNAQGQSAEYQKNKVEKIAKGSVFTRIIKKEIPANIVYEDSLIIAFVPLKKQAPVHLLIVPKKEIYGINEITEEDVFLLGKMLLVAKKLATENGIAESGYRLSINTNEDAGQSVFHLHMHLLGGRALGGMINDSK